LFCTVHLGFEHLVIPTSRDDEICVILTETLSLLVIKSPAGVNDGTVPEAAMQSGTEAMWMTAPGPDPLVSRPPSEHTVHLHGEPSTP
jgi:hypothetical protein